MSQFPAWVPDDVVTTFQQLPTEASHFDQPDRDALRRCMESRAMEKAWNSITRRQAKCEPKRFASAILSTHFISRTQDTDRAPSNAKKSACKALSANTKKLSDELDTFLSTLPDLHVRLWFSDDAQESLKKLADRLDNYSLLVAKRYKSLKNLSGQPKSKNFRATLMIRLLSDEMLSLYGTPLHNVVALTCNAIFQKDITEEDVRNTVRNRKRQMMPPTPG